MNVNNDDDDDVPTTSSNNQQQLQVNAEIKFDNELLVDREHNILKIETDVSEISQIMNEISTLIHGQGESIDTIENHVSDVEENVVAGEVEIRKASTYQQKIRKKAFFILIILLIIALIVAFSIYSKK